MKFIKYATTTFPQPYCKSQCSRNKKRNSKAISDGSWTGSYLEASPPDTTCGDNNNDKRNLQSTEPKYNHDQNRGENIKNGYEI